MAQSRFHRRLRVGFVLKQHAGMSLQAVELWTSLYDPEHAGELHLCNLCPSQEGMLRQQ